MGLEKWGKEKSWARKMGCEKSEAGKVGLKSGAKRKLRREKWGEKREVRKVGREKLG